MALSGSFQSSKDNGANINESNPRFPSYIYVIWEATQNIVNNTSTLSWKCYGGSDYNDADAYVACGPVVVKINDTTVLNITNRFRMVKDQLIGSGSLTIYHNADGSKSINVGITATVYSLYDSNCTYSGTITLDTIPRSSSLSLSATSLSVGGTITANISSYSSSFTHMVEFYINNTYYKSYTDVKDSQSFSIPTSWCAAMPTSTSCTAYCRVTTYNNGVPIGDQIYKTFTITIPNDIKPTIGTINVSPENIIGQSILVKGKNKVIFSVSGCIDSEGSSIKSYTFAVLSGSTVVDSKTTTDTSVTFGVFSQSGTLKFRLTVTDNRGRTTSNSGSEPELICYDYYNPYFKSFKAYRANSNGNADVNGTYLKCTYTQDYALVNDTNSTTVTVHYNGNTSNNTLIYLGNNNTTYRVYLTITDSYGGSGTSSTEIIFGKSRILNITSDGTGVAIGKMSDKTDEHKNGLFECAFDANFYKNVTFSEPDLIRTNLGAAASGYGFGEYILASNRTVSASWSESYNSFWSKADTMLATMGDYTSQIIMARGVTSDIDESGPYQVAGNCLAIIYRIDTDNASIVTIAPGSGNSLWRMQKVNGSWGKIEWINPPMTLSVEYRTTERFNGKPVYAKAVNVGVLPNNTYKEVHIAYNIDAIVRLDGYAYWNTSTYTDKIPLTKFAVESVLYGNASLRFSTSSNLSSYNAYAVLYYTKTTD